MYKIAQEFSSEGYVSPDQLDRDLVALAQDPRAEETLASMIRAFQALNCVGEFLGFGKLEAVANLGEDLLGKLRDGVIDFSPELALALSATIDVVRYMLGEIEATGASGTRDFTRHINLLKRLNGTPGLERKSVPSPVIAVSACAVPALRCHAAEEPKPMTVTAPSVTPTSSPLPVTASAISELTTKKHLPPHFEGAAPAAIFARYESDREVRAYASTGRNY